jgi:hypothetical protein
MASRKGVAEPQFLSCVRQYLSSFAVVREIDGEGQPARHVPHGRLQENTFYLLDAEAVCAPGHAIEDLAMEEANGHLLAVFHQFHASASHRERYGHLAATIDQVDLIDSASPLPQLPHLKLIRDRKQACKSFVGVLYEGRRHQALFLAEQANRARRFEDRQFEGFFTFSPRLVASVKRDLLELAAGRLPVLREFFRLRAVDRLNKQLTLDFARERVAIESAVQRLLRESHRYQPVHFAEDLEKGLSRLRRWKTRLPELLAMVGRSPTNPQP